MKLHVFLAMAVAMAHADPKPVRPSAGRGEVKVDSYLYRPDGRGVGSRGMGGRNPGYSLMGGYDVMESNGEGGNVGQQYADQLRAEGAAAAAEANAAAQGLQFGQKTAFAGNGGISQASQGFSYGVGDGVAAGGVGGSGHVGGGLGVKCPEGHAFDLGGGGIVQGSNAVNFAHGVEAAGYQGGFASGFGVGDQGYHLNGLYQAASAAAASGGSHLGGLSLGVGHSGLQGFLGGAGGQAAAAGAGHAQAQGAYQNLRSQVTAALPVLGSGKLASQQNDGGRVGVDIGASSAYGGAGHGESIVQNVEVSNLARGFEAANSQGSLQAGNVAAYAGHDAGAQINTLISGLDHGEGIRYAGLAANVALGGAEYSLGEGGGLSLGVGGYSEGAGYLNAGAGSGAEYGYQNGKISESSFGHGAVSQSSIGAGGNAGRVALHGGIQASAASKANGGQSSQSFNVGYGKGGVALGSSGQGFAAQGAHSGASSGAASAGAYLGGGEQAGYGGLAIGGHVDFYNYGFPEGGSSLSAQGGGESKQYAGLGGQEVRGGEYGRLEGFSSGQGRHENYAGLGGSAAGAGGISSASFNSGAAKGSGQNVGVGSFSSGYGNQGHLGVAAGGQAQNYGFGAQQGHGIEVLGSGFLGGAGGNLGGHSGAFGAGGSGQVLGAGGFGGHGGIGGQIGGGSQHSGGSASGFSIGAGIGGRGGHIGQAAGGADFSGLRYASGSGHGASFAAQNTAHIQGVGSPVKHLIVAEGHEDQYYGHPKYHFEYAVNDPHTGDVKNQWESRDGDVVKGAYSLHEPDGTIRIVEYEANKEIGFHAVVKKSGKGVHPAAH